MSWEIRSGFYVLLLLLSVQSWAQEVPEIGEIAVVINDNFADNPFIVRVTPENIHQIISGEIKVSKKGMVNEITHALDTVIIYKSPGCIFSFLKTKDNIRFYDATILTDVMSLSKGIMIGMSRDNFVKTFNIPATQKSASIYRIDDRSGNCHHSLYFEEDKLSTIVIDGCLNE